MSTVIKRRRNSIDFIKNDEGHWISSRDNIGRCFEQFYRSLFSSSHPSIPNDLDDLISPCLLDDDREMLVTIPSPEEIGEVLFSMGSNKAPGPDGMSTLFYKFYWNIIGGEVVEAVSSFFIRGFMLRELNHSFIVLIPKNSNAATVQQYRPISLCNVLYKIVSKLLANKLKRVLHKIDSPWQTTFVPERIIQESTFIAQEIMYEMRKKKGKSPWMGLKIDMEKANDRLEWEFLYTVMKSFGFPEVWNQWVLQCITTPSFSILINGASYGFFKSERGLRQGDPLSPFLFVLAGEVLSRMIWRTGLKDRIKRVKLFRDSEPITHLQCADDLIIFAHAREIDADGIMGCINSFSAWSGQKINLSKSVIMFSKNVSPLLKSRLANMLGINASDRGEKYLGLPLVSGKEKRMALQEVIDKVNSRLQGWKMKVLSQAARGSLIRSVSSSIPSYHMSSLLLPKSMGKKLNSIDRNFWWGIDEKKHGLFLRSWDSICLPKWAGGIGMRKREDLNKALVAKLSWEVASNSGKKWVQLFRKKYVKHRNFMKMQCPKFASWAAMSIFNAKMSLAMGFAIRLGMDGVRVYGKTHGFLKSQDLFPLAPNDISSSDVYVASLIDLDSRQWDRGQLFNLFDMETAMKILKINLPHP